MGTNIKTVLLINGSASDHSANQKLIDQLIVWTTGLFEVIICKDLKSLPHFSPELSTANTPEPVLAFRRQVETADGVIICTPEYIFSIPSGLKNALEWCVATTVFTSKPLGIITASANGQKGHEELQLIMQTLMATFTPDTTLLIQGIKGKIDAQYRVTDPKTVKESGLFLNAFRALLPDN